MIDFLVLLVVALAAWRGWRVGVAAFAFRLTGLVLGLIFGLRIAGLLSPSVSPVAHVLLGGVCAVGGLLVGSALGSRLGGSIADVLRRAHIGIVDAAAGAVAQGAVALVGCWLIAALVLAVGPARWADPVRAGLLVGDGRASAPVAGRFVAAISAGVRAAVPEDVAALVPASGTALPAVGTISRVESAVAGSVFVVAANGCSGTVVGTGFAAARGLVVTNAHVVRGTASPTIRTGHGELAATVVVLDRRADLAVLRVPGLAAAPLSLRDHDASNGTQAVVVGYPAGGPRTAIGAAVLQRLPVPDPGFSDGVRFHQAYRIDAAIRHGNSGSPLLDTSGRVVGVVNALAGADGSRGYAIAIDELRPDLAVAMTSYSTAPVNACP